VSKRAILFLIAFAAFAVMPAFAAKTILYYDSECCRNITEGEFAILYCQALNLREPAQGWTVQSAAAALSSLGHQPEGGWVLSRFLTESAMSRLLRNSKLYRKPFNEQDFQRSTKLVTIANARNVVPTNDALTQGEFAVLLARALNIPAPARPTPEAAIRLLLSQPLPVKPLAGWQPDAPLHESEMLEILAATPFRASSVDATAEISALQAFSLLFGKFEIATQGHFGVYIVEALSIPSPEGGWTTTKALDYVVKECGVSGRYGVNRNAPLCADFFVDSLRSILLKLWQPANTAPQGKGASALLRLLRLAVPRSGEMAVADVAFSPIGSFEFAPQQKGKSSGPSAKDVDKFINDVRASGLLPSNQCQPVAAQGFSKAQQGPIGPVQPAGTPMPRLTPQPPPAASETLPNPQKPPPE
jgi:hypothetical protein